jgi:hypothetical protein
LSGQQYASLLRLRTQTLVRQTFAGGATADLASKIKQGWRLDYRCGERAGSQIADAVAADHDRSGHDGSSDLLWGSGEEARRNWAVAHKISKIELTQIPARRRLLGLSLASLAIALAICASAACDSRVKDGASSTRPGPPRAYHTRFDRDENPLSEDGAWATGQTLGRDWSDVAVASGFAYGLESGTRGYDDSVALLTGDWGPDQTIEATVHTANQNDAIFEEVELRLRSVLAPHRSTGYEINFRCSKTANAYAEIVRWNGRFGDFTYLKKGHGASFGVANGDVVKATAVGRVITAFINGVQILQATDSAYPYGSPGIGFFLQGPAGTVNRDFGLTEFSADSR